MIAEKRTLFSSFPIWRQLLKQRRLQAVTVALPQKFFKIEKAERRVRFLATTCHVAAGICIGARTCSA